MKREVLESTSKVEECTEVKKLSEEPLKLYKRAKARLRSDADHLTGREKERESVRAFWQVGGE